MGLEDKVLFERIKQYKAMGVDGVEAFYKNYKKDEEADNIRKTLQMASILGLLISGGSDYHRDREKGRFPNGGDIADQVLVDLKKARIVQNAEYQRHLVTAQAGR